MPAGPLTFLGNVDLLSSCESTCYALVDKNFTLTTSSWNAFVNLNLGDTADSRKVTVESVVLLPSEFYNAGILGNERSTFLSRCDVVRNNVTRSGMLDQTCLKGVYSLTMGLRGNPIGKFVMEVTLTSRSCLYQNRKKYDSFETCCTYCICRIGLSWLKAYCHSEEFSERAEFSIVKYSSHVTFYSNSKRDLLS